MVDCYFSSNISLSWLQRFVDFTHCVVGANGSSQQEVIASLIIEFRVVKLARISPHVHSKRSIEIDFPAAQ